MKTIPFIINFLGGESTESEIIPIFAKNINNTNRSVLTIQNETANNLSNEMEEKIKKELAEYGFSMDDLTKEELVELKLEIRLKEEGHVVLDGVLFSKPMYFKKTGVDSE